MLKKITSGIFTGNQLKIIAIIAMTCDHAGKMLFPDIAILQIIGRTAFPIFAYMIAEGCKYTKNRKKYLATMTVIAFTIQIVYYIAIKSMYMSIFVTFSMSIALIYTADYAKENMNLKSIAIILTAFALVFFITQILPGFFEDTDFWIDYAFLGVMLPVGVYFANTKPLKLLIASVIITADCILSGGIQWYALLALPLIALYNGRRGTAKLKYMFYMYYPFHLAVIYVIALMI